MNVVVPTDHLPLAGSHRWMTPAQSPDRRRPVVTGDQSTAYPSSLCPENVCAAGVFTAALLAASLAASAVAVASCSICVCTSHTCAPRPTGPLSRRRAREAGEGW
jgi:hypothetical protein